MSTSKTVLNVPNYTCFEIKYTHKYWNMRNHGQIKFVSLVRKYFGSLPDSVSNFFSFLDINSTLGDKLSFDDSSKTLIAAVDDIIEKLNILIMVLWDLNAIFDLKNRQFKRKFNFKDLSLCCQHD